jgi:hypothetical protein
MRGTTAPVASSAPGPGRRAGRLTTVAWIPAPSRDIDIAEWADIGRRFGSMGRCAQWGLGDWVRYGNAKFGERYARAARITGYDVQSLMNMVYVASRYEISRRRESLSWSHHETVASLEIDEQDCWLNRAESQKLSVLDLRTELRSARRRPKNTSQSEGVRRDDTNVLVCPYCGGQVSVSQSLMMPAAE